MGRARKAQLQELQMPLHRLRAGSRDSRQDPALLTSSKLK